MRWDWGDNRRKKSLQLKIIGTNGLYERFMQN
jgi:hypothetical protein